MKNFIKSSKFFTGCMILCFILPIYNAIVDKQANYLWWCLFAPILFIITYIGTYIYYKNDITENK